MATYKVTDPTTGKSLSLTGDSPPTEQELNDIFSQVHGDQPPTTPTQPSFLDTLGAVSEMTPWNKLRAATTDALGQKVAETGGAMGHPNIGAVAGTAIQMAPDVVAAGAGYQDFQASESPIAQAIKRTPQEIGTKMGQGEKAVGITERLPELRGAKTSFPKPEMNVPTKAPAPIVPAETVPSVPPQSYPRDPNTFVNSARSRIDKFGKALSPQELSDYKRQLTTWLSDGTLNPRTPIGAIASQLKTDVTALHNAAIPGRAELNSVYGLSKTLHPDVIGALKDYAAKYGKRTLAEAIAIAVGGGAAYKIFRR